MAELIAKSPCEGLVPATIGGMSLTEEHPGAMWTVAPFKGQQEALSKALETAHGMAFPAANRATGKAGSRAVWFGRDMALLMGLAPDAKLAGHAALTDQSDAWAVVRLEGAGAEDVLARLVPVDLRNQVFKRGHTARTELKHMMASVTRTGPQAFQIMVFRSMAKTLVHDLKTAMEAVAARG
ncbi:MULTISPECIES: sarcosine oxidase subunit gamma [unclassified Leisingera]|uniref:sarcosine oxidase subunit gamma n=1 Tax=unclassified Leisingera TaxID=2614906 RepID=UPI0010123183|nr:MULTISPECIES: sarcosine oxidase subunit gamma [unclassified Leisingera]MBQ4826265.1 sarcosine oxidase subunit gamma [Leisingera sp. HS039]QAX30351.1 sarcosine oxidase subunit gamma [Leisingera sp. NJS204]QBR35671.1 sarcosine oxidase subunit gamma [Leisingera sp. NJS201]